MDLTIAGPRTKAALALIERHRRRDDQRRRRAAPPPRTMKEKMQGSQAKRSIPPIPVASKIGDVAQQLGLTLRAIRLYEEMGLIACGRGPKNGRVLDDLAKARLSTIVDLKRLGLKISEISDLLAPDGLRSSILRDRLEARLSTLDQQRARLGAYLARLTAPEHCQSEG